MNIQDQNIFSNAPLALAVHDIILSSDNDLDTSRLENASAGWRVKLGFIELILAEGKKRTQ